MVLFARNDIRSFHNPASNHTHSRPAKGDGFVPLWGIDCPPCEAALTGNPAWSPSRYKIPLTPDEALEAADAKAAAEAAIHQQQLMLAQQGVMAALASKNIGPEINPEDIAITSETDEPSPSVEAPAGPNRETMKADYRVLSKPDLKDLAKERGLAVSGTVDELIDRLVDSDLE